ncbi:MAG: M23 family metallopeptidase, partial [Methylobacter sp.]
KHATAKTISAAHLQSKHTKPVNKKKSVAAPKSTTKKQTIVSAKLNKSKQSIAWYKSSHKTDSRSAEPATRKHTVISYKSIKSVSAEPINYKTLQKNIPTNLNLDNVESDQIVHTNNDKQFRPILIDRLQNTKVNTAHVSIETSLFLDGLEAGLSKELILQLTDIFAWDIDFATNLHPGDQFTVVHGKKMVDGKETDNDEIIAAEFINQGISYTAIRYINESGIASYYTPDGQSMQRAFLSTPVDFARISSHFDMHRKHPILNRIRAHKGIDYAARTGTPVKTTGDGVVTFSGRKGGYGRVVIIQHNDHYETLYAHMSDFKKDLTVGNHVKQGDVIGYVGQTGLATGPHLHYEFHVDGLYRDPETVKIPHSMPISNALLADFKAQTQPFFAQLNQVKAKSLFAKTPSRYD